MFELCTSKSKKLFECIFVSGSPFHICICSLAGDEDKSNKS